MVFLESLNVVHMDLRADNVLVNEEGKVKIGDFGLTQILGSSMNAGISQFPVRWTAPEIMCGPATYTTKCDVWSFGVLIFEILTCGMLPYGDLSLQQVRDGVPKGLRLPSPTIYGFECDATIYSIMQSCWNMDPQKRPVFKEIYTKTQQTIIKATKFYSNAVSTDRD
ncbi:unnamed protein product [Hymenolepis diminuta]|nr:unnamed protein product [Hymenolepis diminuta]